MKDKQTCNLVDSREILSPVSMEMSEKSPFGFFGFFSQRKILLMIRIFDLILDFSKETHPESGFF